MGVDGLLVVPHSWASELETHIAPLQFLGCGEGKGVKDLERYILFAAYLLGNGIESVGEIIHKHCRQMEILALRESCAVDVRGNHPDELCDVVLGLRVAAFDTEGQFAIFQRHIAHKGLGRPQHAVTGAAFFQHINRCGTRGVQHQCVVHPDATGHIGEGVVGDGDDIDVGFVGE